MNAKPNSLVGPVVLTGVVLLGVAVTSLLFEPYMNTSLRAVEHLVIVVMVIFVFIPLVRRLRADAVRLAASERRAEEAHQRFEELFRQAPDGMVAVDNEGSISLANDAMDPMFGYEADELVGKQLEALIPERLREHHADLRATWELNPVRRTMGTGLDRSGLRKDGTEFPIRCSVGPSQADGIVAIATIRDITDLKDARDSLDAYSKRLERSNEQLEDFAVVAAHDMQEPLRKVELFAGRLLAVSGNDLNEWARDDLVRVEGSVRRMRNLVDSLLSYSHVSSQDIDFESIDLRTLITEVIYDLHSVIGETGGNVHVGHVPVIEADPIQMSQLFSNLITNALTFQRPDVPPQVTVEGQIIGDDTSDGSRICRLTVRDNGIGFDETHSDEIFSIFRRLHGRSEYPGTGIGLAMSRRIVERHGGEITATSTPGEGSTFTVSLPVNHDARTGTGRSSRDDLHLEPTRP